MWCTLHAQALLASVDPGKDQRAVVAVLVQARFLAEEVSHDRANVEDFKMRSKVHGARCTVQGARCKVHGARCTVHGARCKVHGARCKVHGARCKV